jgi:hypothetical protein
MTEESLGRIHHVRSEDVTVMNSDKENIDCKDCAEIGAGYVVTRGPKTDKPRVIVLCECEDNK